MRPFILFAACALATPAGATPPDGDFRCTDTRGGVLRVTLAPDACRVGTTNGTRRTTASEVECRVSNPQLRILMLGTDGAFTFEDTDTDIVRRGTCAPA